MRRILFCLVGLALAACDEQPYGTYETLSAAVAAGEEERGWLPVWLPRSAGDLHLQGDLDTNDWWLRARLSAAAADSLRVLLSPVPTESVRVRHPRRGGSWWFEDLVQHQPANDGALSAELFRGTGDPVPTSTIVAFDRISSNRVHLDARRALTCSVAAHGNGGSASRKAG